MIDVVSSNLSQVGYEEENQTLKVVFKNGDLYHYFGVPKEVFELMLKSESIGKFFNQHVKNKYQYGKISP